VARCIAPLALLLGPCRRSRERPLAAWRIARDGAAGAAYLSRPFSLTAFYEAGKGWRRTPHRIDLAGAPAAPAAFRGQRGPQREIRTATDPEHTRLVLILPGTRLNPRKYAAESEQPVIALRLELEGLRSAASPSLGEGSLEAPTVAWFRAASTGPLPSVPSAVPPWSRPGPCGPDPGASHRRTA